MSDDEYVDDFIAAGLYDPEAPDAEAMLELLEYLVDELDASIPEIVKAVEEDQLLSFAGFRHVRPDGARLTLNEMAAAADVDAAFAQRVWRAAGFPAPRPFERRFDAADVRILELMKIGIDLVGEDGVIQLMRTLGAATQQIAESEVALVRSQMEAPLLSGQRYVDVARSYRDAVVGLLPQVINVIDALHRHHIENIVRRYAGAGPPSPVNVVSLAVGFADLSGYTGLSAQLDASQLSLMLTRFEEVTGDVVASAGASIAKRIGDAVMFVTNAPGIACALAIELVEACARERLPKLRAGVAFGDVIVRHGDFYGSVVNMAARLVAAAEPGTVLADPALHERLHRVRGPYTFMPAGRITLAGFGDPVETFQLLRP
ncbi:MAG TPA: adenylate/guanylate cyclase domain-containing protein [Acidimicrobiia bacterium]|nr:adenylate/guanylate cyclase domain-containing protein [Acidimicrobiia bacterium]